MLRHPLGTPRSAVEVRAALHDGEQRLLGRAGVGPEAAVEPAERALVGEVEAGGVVGVGHAVPAALVVAGQCVLMVGSPAAEAGSPARPLLAPRSSTRRRAVVEGHDDVRAQLVLHPHRQLGREVHLRAVEVRAEPHAVVGDPARVGHREHLKAPRVGEHGPLPPRPLLQPTHAIDEVGPRSEQQVIGVAENDLRADPADLLGQQALDAALRAHGHERGRLERPVRRFDHADASPGLRVGVAVGDGEAKRCHWYSIWPRSSVLDREAASRSRILTIAPMLHCRVRKTMPG